MDQYLLFGNSGASIVQWELKKRFVSDYYHRILGTVIKAHILQVDPERMCDTE